VIVVEEETAMELQWSSPPCENQTAHKVVTV